MRVVTDQLVVLAEAPDLPGWRIRAPAPLSSRMVYTPHSRVSSTRELAVSRVVPSLDWQVSYHLREPHLSLRVGFCGAQRRHHRTSSDGIIDAEEDDPVIVRATLDDKGRSRV